MYSYVSQNDTARLRNGLMPGHGEDALYPTVHLSPSWYLDHPMTQFQVQDIEAEEELEEYQSLPLAILQLVLFILVVMPAILFLVGLGLGGILAAIESWAFIDGFFYVAAICVNATNPLTNQSPTTAFGKVMAVVTAAWGISILIVFLSMIGGPVFTPIANFLRVHSSGRSNTSFAWCVLKLLGLCFVFVPAVLCAAAAVLAGPLAAIEGWPWIDGFWWLIALMTAMTNPLTNRNPTTHGGKIVSILFDAWSLGVLGLALATIAASLVPTLSEHLRFGGYRSRPKAPSTRATLPNFGVYQLPHPTPSASPPIMRHFAT